MAFWLIWTAALYVGQHILGIIYRPKPKGERRPRALGLGDFDVPTIEEGRPIPVVCGTVRLKGPSVVWYGDVASQTEDQVTRYSLGVEHLLCHGPIDSLTQVFFGETVCEPDFAIDERFGRVFVVISKSLREPPPNSAQGDKYIVASGGSGPWSGQSQKIATLDPAGWTFLSPDTDFAVHVLDERTPFIFNGTTWVAVTWAGTVGVRDFDQPFLFGGSAEGGVSGRMRIHYGDDPETPNAYLEEHQNGERPAYPGFARVVFEHMYLGNSRYLTPPSWVITKYPNELGVSDDMHKVGADANAICFLFEVMTNARWGLRYSAGEINLDNFRAAAETTYNEGVGISVNWDSSRTGEEMADEIMRHVDGLCQRNPRTGLWEITLTRADYDVEDLPVLNESDIISYQIGRADLVETVNTVRVKFVDRLRNFATSSTPALQDLAGIQQMGGQIVPEELDFPLFTNMKNALWAGHRALMTLSYPTAPLELVTNRKAWDFMPGKPFVLNLDPEGIVSAVFRTSRAQMGSLTSGEILLTTMEDIFGVVFSAYNPPPDSGWEDPNEPPQTLLTQRAFEAPLWMQIGFEPPPTVQPRALTFAVRGEGLVLGVERWIREGGSGSFQYAGFQGILTASGVLAADLLPNQYSMVVNDIVDRDRLRTVSFPEFASGVNLCVIDDEILAWNGITSLEDPSDCTFSLIERGQPDTTPKAHTAGTRVWFFTKNNESGGPFAGVGFVRLFVPTGGETSQETQIKMPVVGGSGTQGLDGAPTLSVTIGLPGVSWRVSRPYLPAYITLNGSLYPATIPMTDLELAWTERNRFMAWTFDQAGATDEREADVIVEIKVFGEVGTLVHTENVPPGTSEWTYPSATEIAESGLGRLNNTLRVEIRAKLGATYSLQYYDHSVSRV